MKDKATDKTEIMRDNEGHSCPRCGSRDIAFVTPSKLIGVGTIYQNPNTGNLELRSSQPDGQYYRFKCNNCKASTKNHVNLARAISEWNSLREPKKGT